MNDIVTTCVILHNMVVEDERHLHTDACEFSEPNGPPHCIQQWCTGDSSTHGSI
jgi:hypothetical protein